jgi:hypothetical protein
MDPILRQRIELLGCSHLLQGERGSSIRNTPDDTPAIDPRFAFGINSSATVLPALGITFDELRDVARRLEKPILDVGASYSTVACEAHWRGIPVFSTDLGCDRNRLKFLTQVQNNLTKLQELYASGEHSHGNYLAPIPADRWEAKVVDAISTLAQQLSECPASDIRLPGGWQANDRHFSVVYSHHAVPQYCTPDSFLGRDLPELLRVAAHTLLLHPFQLGNTPLNPANEGDAIFIKTVREKATAAGFEFTLLSCPTASFPEAQTARFTRLDSM